MAQLGSGVDALRNCERKSLRRPRPALGSRPFVAWIRGRVGVVIDEIHDTRRLRSALRHPSPAEFEARPTQQAAWTPRPRSGPAPGVAFIGQAYASMSMADLCRKEGFSSATF